MSGSSVTQLPAPSAALRWRWRPEGPAYAIPSTPHFQPHLTHTHHHHHQQNHHQLPSTISHISQPVPPAHLQVVWLLVQARQYIIRQVHSLRGAVQLKAAHAPAGVEVAYVYAYEKGTMQLEDGPRSGM